MLTEDQVKADAKQLVTDLLLDLRVRGLSFSDEEAVLLEAAKVLGTASQILIKMISDKMPATMH